MRIAREREREGFFLDPSRPRSDVVADLAPTADAARLLVSETGGAERSLAVTGLERFARCAFQGYAQVVLAARDTDAKDELPDAREEGTLIHEALAAAFLATRELWPRRPRPEEEILATGEAAADAVLERWQGHAPLRAVVRLRVRDAVRAMLRVALEDDTWDFALAEQPFGARSGPTWSPLVLREGDLPLSLRGSIDRVDRAHDGRSLRVIDYKRSKTTVQAAARSLGRRRSRSRSMRASRRARSACRHRRVRPHAGARRGPRKQGQREGRRAHGRARGAGGRSARGDRGGAPFRWSAAPAPAGSCPSRRARRSAAFVR